MWVGGGPAAACCEVLRRRQRDWQGTEHSKDVSVYLPGQSRAECGHGRVGGEGGLNWTRGRRQPSPRRKERLAVRTWVVGATCHMWGVAMEAVIGWLVRTCKERGVETGGRGPPERKLRPPRLYSLQQDLIARNRACRCDPILKEQRSLSSDAVSPAFPHELSSLPSSPPLYP